MKSKFGKEFYWMLGQVTLIGLTLAGFQWAFNLYLLGFWTLHILVWIAIYAVGLAETKRQKMGEPYQPYVSLGIVNDVSGVILYVGNVIFLAALGYLILTGIAFITTFFIYAIMYSLKTHWEEQESLKKGIDKLEKV